MNKLLLSVLFTALVVGGGAFYGGMQYQKSKTPVAAGMFAGGFPQGQNGMRTARTGTTGVRNAGSFTSGTVTTKDASSVTLSLRDGGSKIIFYSTSTTIGKMASGSSDDLKTGTQVTVAGSQNTDGSIVANSIQIRPEGEPGAASAPTVPPQQK